MFFSDGVHTWQQQLSIERQIAWLVVSKVFLSQPQVVPANAFNTLLRCCTLLRYCCSVVVRIEVASSRPDHLPTLLTGKTSEMSLLVNLHLGLSSRALMVAKIWSGDQQSNIAMQTQPSARSPVNQPKVILLTTSIR